MRRSIANFIVYGWIAMLSGCGSQSDVNVSCLVRIQQSEDEDQQQYDRRRETQKLLVMSPFVHDEVLRQLRAVEPTIVAQLENPRQWLAERLSVETPADSELMQISFRAPSDFQAKSVLNFVTQTLIDEVDQSRRDSIARQLEELRKRKREKSKQFESQAKKIRELQDKLLHRAPRDAVVQSDLGKIGVERVLHNILQLEIRLFENQEKHAAKNTQDPASIRLLERKLMELRKKYQQSYTELKVEPNASEELESEQAVRQRLQNELHLLDEQIDALERELTTTPEIEWIQPAQNQPAQ